MKTAQEAFEATQKIWVENPNTEVLDLILAADSKVEEAISRGVCQAQIGLVRASLADAAASQFEEAGYFVTFSPTNSFGEPQFVLGLVWKQSPMGSRAYREGIKNNNVVKV